MLAGAGIIDADVSNQGSVNPGMPGQPGSLTINGTYAQGPSGQLIIEVASPEDFDQLNVNGTVSLAGTLAVVPLMPLAFGQKLHGFLTADSVQGAFDTILLPAGFRGRVIDDEGMLTLLIAPASYTQIAKSPNQFRTAQALDEWIGIETGDIGVITLALDELTAAQYPVAFEAISPAFYSSLLTISIEQSQARGQVVNQQLGASRLSGRPSIRLQGVEPSPIAYDKDGKSVLEPKTLEPRLRLIPAGASGSSARDSLPNWVLSTAFQTIVLIQGAFSSAATIPGTSPSSPVFTAAMKERMPITPIPAAHNRTRFASASMAPTRQGAFIPTPSSAAPSRDTTSIDPSNGPGSNAAPTRGPREESSSLFWRLVTIGRWETLRSARA